jgi:CBS domain-containing protein
MKRKEPISNVMSSSVESVDVNDKLSVVRHLLLEGSFHHVPIVEERKLVGIISSRDMLRLPFDVSGISEDAVDEGLDKSFTIEQVMHRDLVTIDRDDTVQTAIDLLARGKFHSLPVVDEEGTLIGIVTSIDLLAYLMA